MLRCGSQSVIVDRACEMHGSGSYRDRSHQCEMQLQWRAEGSYAFSINRDGDGGEGGGTIAAADWRLSAASVAPSPSIIIRATAFHDHVAYDPIDMKPVRDSASTVLLIFPPTLYIAVLFLEIIPQHYYIRPPVISLSSLYYLLSLSTLFISNLRRTDNRDLSSQGLLERVFLFGSFN